MSELTKIREDHAALAKLFAQLRSMVESSRPPSRLVLFDLRRELVSTLLAHLKLEDWALYPRLRDSSDRAVSDIGRKFQQEMGGLAPAFVALLRQVERQCDRRRLEGLSHGHPPRSRFARAPHAM